MGMTRHVTDIFISPKISALTGCGATDVSTEFPLYPEWIKGIWAESGVPEPHP